MNQENYNIQSNMQLMDYNQPKKKKTLPLLLILLIIIIIGGGFYVYYLYFYKVSTHQVVDGLFNKVFSQSSTIEKVIDNTLNFDYKNDILQGNFNLKLDLEGNIDGQKIDLKNINLNYQITTNIKNKELLLKANTSQNNKNIININAFLKSDKAYFNSNIFDHPYFTTYDSSIWDEIDDFIDDTSQYNASDLKTIISKNKTFIRNTIKEEYLSQESGAYEIDNTTISGLKTTIELTQSRLNEMKISYYNEVLADDEYLNILAKTGKVTKEEIRNNFYQKIENIKSSQNISSSSDITKINIYTTKNGEFLAADITSNNKTMLTAVLKNNIITFKVHEEDGIVSYTFNYDTINKELIFEYDGLNIKVQFDDTSFRLYIIGDNINATMLLNIKNTNNIIGYDLELSGSFKQSNNLYKESIKLNADIQKIDRIDSFKVDNAKNINDITEEEIQTITNRLEKAIQGTYIETIIQSIQNVFSKLSTTMYDNNYDIIT